MWNLFEEEKNNRSQDSFRAQKGVEEGEGGVELLGKLWGPNFLFM